MRIHLLVLAGACLALGSSCSTAVSRYLEWKISPDDDRRSLGSRIAVPVSTETAIVLDSHGVPHIRSDNEHDLYFAYGYAQARDRRFQMEALKFLAAGRIRELSPLIASAPDLRRAELYSRLMGLYLDADAVLDQASPDDRALFQAFADGINAATRIEPLPMEFRLLDRSPEPWTAHDSCLILAMVSFNLCKDWEMELFRLELAWNSLQRGGSLDRTLAIWPSQRDLGPHLVDQTMDPSGHPASQALNHAAIPSGPAPELRAYLESLAGSAPVVSAPARPEAQPENPLAVLMQDLSASNNWAIGGQRSGTGGSVLESDPHLVHMMPPMGYLAHLEKAGASDAWSAIGAGFAGLPAITFGTNGQVAWGATANWADVSDLYVEQAVAGSSEFYWYQGKKTAFAKRREFFKVAQADGSLKEETITVRESLHGVILNDIIPRLGPDFPLVALRRDHFAGPALSAMRQLYRSHDVIQAHTALLDFTAFVGHWALADAGGHIAYAGLAALPRRTSHSGTWPVPGWNSQYEWQGTVPSSELPWLTDPPQGWIASANNQVVAPDSVPWPLNEEGDMPFRYLRIAKGLAVPGIEAATKLQVDAIDEGWLACRSLFLAALESAGTSADNPRKSSLWETALRQLAAWDGSCQPDQTGPVIFNTLVASILELTLSDELPPAAFAQFMGYFNNQPMVYDILLNPRNPAWDDVNTPAVETAKEVIDLAFSRSIALLSQKYGSDPKRWTWDRAAPFVLQHPLGGNSALSRDTDRLMTARGAINTVNKHQFSLAEAPVFTIRDGPVLRVLVNLADPDQSYMVLPGGQSGRPTSRHYDDLLALYRRGSGIPMEMSFDKVRQSSEGVITLVPMP